MNQNPPDDIVLSITHMGGLGDGVGQHEGQSVYVSYTCPGDVVQVSPLSKHAAALRDVLTPSTIRTIPACPHFSQCGGCDLQHLEADYYREVKQDRLRRMVAQLKAAPAALQPMVEIGPQTRRKVTFKLSHHATGVEIGFFAAKSHQVIPLQACPMMEPPLFALIAPLKTILNSLKNPRIIHSITASLLANGLDVTLHVTQALSAKERQKWADSAVQNGWVRLCEQQKETTVLHDSGAASITFGEVSVALPPNAFLQATQQGQAAITAQVCEALQGCDHPVDLYSGCGTYSFPLLQQATRVSAFEGGQHMIAAMQQAALSQGLESRLTATARDLYRRPLTMQELNHYDGVVINPPRNGALPQIQQMAQSTVRQVVMVSCNPATFERDAKTLIAGGYALHRVTAIDQFYWSHHLEVVGVFKR